MPGPAGGVRSHGLGQLVGLGLGLGSGWGVGWLAAFRPMPRAMMMRAETTIEAARNQSPVR